VQRYAIKSRSDEDALTADIINLASQYGRYGYRRITAMLHQKGWQVNHKRVERIWRREGLKVPKKQPKRSLMMVPVSGEDQSIGIMFGPMILFKTGHMMARSSAFLLS